MKKGRTGVAVTALTNIARKKNVVRLDPHLLHIEVRHDGVLHFDEPRHRRHTRVGETNDDSAP
jgi:hypothetical protein